jgi:kynureninase
MPAMIGAGGRETFRANESFARELDRTDPLRSFRERFHLPVTGDGRQLVYLCGNSLGLQPVGARAIVEQELDDWARLAVDAHFRGQRPWYSYHERVREAGARLVGALPHEVVFMNGLTVNLHLMMVSFYRPTRERYKIVIDHPAFPSDIYAARTQLRWRGIDPSEGLLVARPRPGEDNLRMEDVEALLEREGRRIAMLLLPGVNYFTGQAYDLARVARAARAQGCIVGLDLAHAAGNVLLRLHEWEVDFAAWCTYKYLNSGPGAVAGCFVHERHARDTSLSRFGGWWGNDPTKRFRMHLEPEFVPVASADAWQLSNPPILSMAPLIASLEIFEAAEMPALRAKSVRLTGYLESLLREGCGAPDDRDGSGAATDGPARAARSAPISRDAARRFELITPSDPEARGCQLSLRFAEDAREMHNRLERAGIVCDVREPDILRVAPAPLYNTFHEVWRFARALGAAGSS